MEKFTTERVDAYEAFDPAQITKPIGVLVVHGMGQQAQFETLHDVVTAFVKAHCEQGWKLDSRIDPVLHLPKEGTVDMSKPRHDSDELIPVAQVTLSTDGGKKTQDFDFFEAYWAPLTENVVGLKDVFIFLLRAAWEGFLSSLKGKFSRFTFGDQRSYSVSRYTAPQLLVAAAVVLSFLIVGFSYWFVLGWEILHYFDASLGAATLENTLRLNLARFLVGTTIFLAFPLLNATIQLMTRDTVSKIARIANFIWMVPYLLAVVLFGVSITAAFLSHGRDDGITSFFDDWYVRGAGALHATAFVFFPLWTRQICFVGLGIWLCYKAWYFLVKYFGDVVAYVSAHSVNRFWYVREQIQDRCMLVAKAVYTRREEHDASKLRYDHIVVISHSLGTVIAYDILNWLLSLQLCGEKPPCVEHVEKRTRLFLTCGSPLNKVAFLFRFNVGFLGMKVWRDRLSNYKQPLILDHKWRPHRWINIWSYPDWISGPLTYFEWPEPSKRELLDWIGTPAGKSLVPVALEIQNLPDPDAFIPLMAHTEYFNHQQFRTALYHGIWSAAAQPGSTAPKKAKAMSSAS